MTRTATRAVANHPLAVDTSAFLLVAAHFLAARRWSCLDVAARFTHVEAPDLASLFGALAGLAALLAGFAGVVVVFALQAPSPRFQRARRAGGPVLRGIWVGVVVTALLAAFTSAGGALASLLQASWAPWLLEVVLLLCAHAAVRQVAVLHHLARIVAGGDEDAHRADSVVPHDQVRRPGQRHQQ